MSSGSHSLSRCISAVMFIAGLSLFCLSMEIISIRNPMMDATRTDSTMLVYKTNTAAVTDTVPGNDALSSSTTRTRSGAQCLTFDESFDKLVASMSNVFITMPAKAAGTSLKQFTKRCVGGSGEENNNFINRLNWHDGEAQYKQFFEDVNYPKIISSHLYSDTAMIDLLNNVSRKSLVVYMYRDETDRLMSAIRFVSRIRICKNRTNVPQGMEVEYNGESSCILQEKQLMDMVIKTRNNEIGDGELDVMTCDFYRAIEDNFPNMVFVNYKQADMLQEVLAKYHCPELTEILVHTNVAIDETWKVSLKLEKDGSEMALDDWLDAKRDIIEFAATWNVDRQKNYCRSKTRHMQDDLFSCQDELLLVTRDTSF